MTNALLFAASVLIWGSTWIAITWQLGPIWPIVSVLYRFALGGVVMLLGFALLRKLRAPNWRDQPWILAQALTLFSLNFVCFYEATSYVTSGLVSVIFSLATIMNALNGKLFFGGPITARTLVAGAIGALGLALLFAPDLLRNADLDLLWGAALAALGTYLFSLGNMASRRNSARGVSPVIANAWGMAYGALVLLALATLAGAPLDAPPDTAYWAALVYLAVIGSIGGFTAYLLLVARIGSAKAAYATVLFPIVALALSTVFEGYVWTPLALMGAALALAGNVVMFWPVRARG